MMKPVSIREINETIRKVLNTEEAHREDLSGKTRKPSLSTIAIH